MAPYRFAALRVSSEGEAVIRKTSAFGFLVRTCWSRSIPLTLGIMTSDRITS